jgi:murein DD-endopeptidase MepM/ murein hydrolase activator NlpD
LFFDLNGDGLRDKAAMIYLPARLLDEQQSLQPDLLSAIRDYVRSHPELKPGGLMVIDEPALSNFTICVQNSCDITNDAGRFKILNPGPDSSIQIHITDPNAGTPAFAMKTINQWNRSVVIPAYQMDGLQIPDQHLNDTTILPIDQGIIVKINQPNEIGLMQGFFTAPVLVAGAFILSYQDDDPVVGTVLDWKGDTESVCTHDPIPFEVVCDQHQGIDFVPNIRTQANFVYASAGGTLTSADTLPSGEKVVTLIHLIDNKRFQTTYAHLDDYPDTLSHGAQVFSGQIIGTTGASGGAWIDQVHWEFTDLSLPLRPDGSAQSIDPFATLPVTTSSNYWTLFNFPLDAQVK